MSMSIGAGGGFNISQIANNLLSKIDTKQQGFIDKDELTSALSGAASGTSSSSDTTAADQLFKQLDGDGDGKVTESELSNGIQSLVNDLKSQLQQAQLHGGHDGPPPLPPTDGEDNGLTKDELTAIASDSSTNTKQSELFNKLATNFDAADTNGDGRVTRDEAMAYDKANQTSTASSASSTTANTTDGSDASSSVGDNLKMMMQLVKLLEHYGVSNASSSHASVASTSSVSVTA